MAKGSENGPATGVMPDVQSFRDVRRVAIDKVGVRDVVYPMRLRTPDGGEQTTVARINMYVSLPQEQKGTHMSRFLEVLNDHEGPITPDEIPLIARAIRERLDASNSFFSARFPYFIRKEAPVTGMPGMMDYDVTFECASDGTGEDFVIAVRAPATSLCPCSKEISAYGAHNQRCHIEARVRAKGTLWIEDLAGMIERSASMQVYAVLKRPDEKYVTEKAYDNPKFVEDIVRDLALTLEDQDQILWYSVNSTNEESIHNHNAYAELARSKDGVTGV